MMMEFVDDKLALFFDKALLQETVDDCVDKDIHLAEVRWFTQPEHRIALAKQMLSGRYHIAPPHIIQIPKPGSNETRKVYCNEPMAHLFKLYKIAKPLSGCHFRTTGRRHCPLHRFYSERDCDH